MFSMLLLMWSFMQAFSRANVIVVRVRPETIAPGCGARAAGSGEFSAFVLAIVGLAIGLPTALATSRFVEFFLFDVKPNSPASLAEAVAILLSAVLLASYVPARKASRIDPMAAVRHE